MENRDERVCPCCGSGATKLIYRVDSIPIHSCILFTTEEEAATFDRKDLALWFCDSCGFVFNGLFDETTTRYSENFEESQHFSDTFNAFSRSLVQDVVEKCSLRNKHILEIGCGKGEFLRELCASACATGLGIDPSYRRDSGRNEADSSVSFIADYFDERYFHLSGDAVICRHTLEHIPAVSDFVGAIRNLAVPRLESDIFFETPDAKRVLAEGAFWDIYYEHCSYFSAGTHARLFRSHDYDVTELSLGFGGQYILQYAKPSAASTRERLPLERDLDEMRKLAEEFPARVGGTNLYWRNVVQSAFQDGKTVVLWGGGSKGVSFLTTLGFTSEIAALVDVNPYKQNKFSPGTGHRVVAPAALGSIRPDLVIVMNPIYRVEISRQLSELNLDPEILTV